MLSTKGAELRDFIRRLVAFGSMSVLSLGVNLGVTVLLHEVLHASEELSYAIALIVVFTMNFMLSRHVVFRSTSGDSIRQATLFGISTLSFRGLEYVLFLLLHTVMDLWYVGVIVGVSIPMTLVKFLFLGKFVFVPKARSELESS